MMRTPTTLLLFAGMLTGCPVAANAEDDARGLPAADRAQLSVDRIFGSGDFQEHGLGSFRWSGRGSAYFTLDAPKDGAAGRDLVRNDAATGAKQVLVSARSLIPPGEGQPLAVDGFDFSPDETKVLIYTNSKRVWRYNTRGDYWVFDLAGHALRKLGGDAADSTLQFAKFSPDGTRVAYVRERNLYVQDLRNLRITAVTIDGSATRINGTGDWVNEEELDIRDAYRWSPDSRSIAFWQFDTSGVREFHLIRNTDASYPRIVSFPYPKAGERNSATRLGVVPATGGPVVWIDVPGDPREHYLPRMEWAPDSSRIVLQQLNRLQNSNRVMLADPTTGATRVVLTETDAAWLENENPVRWLNQGREFLWLSERAGWRSAYRAGVSDGFARITRDDCDVIQVEAVDEANGWLYYAASPENPVRRDLYRTRLDGGAAERVSPRDQPGWHTYDIAPDAGWAVHTYSTFNTPPVVELVRLPEHKVVRVLVDNQALRDALAALRRPSAEFFRLDIGEGLQLDAWCLKPPDFDAAGSYPLLLHVYGEPHGQTVTDAWHAASGLWHWMLAQRGYVVASVDNRGTNAPRGRDWRKVVHRQIGILAAQEQAAALRALLERWPFVDRKRVGIWGWSGGGSMSLNAVLRYPKLYRTAIAVAPNANQLLYDTIYQERYMGLPADNAAGYREGSPLTHAHKLEGNLLLVHGTCDDNGHYQGTEMLMNALIAHNKRFTVMPYPGRSHDLSEGHNTTRHFYGLLTSYLDEHLGAHAARPKTSQRDARPRYESRTIAGWTVHVRKELLERESAATARALELLREQLEEVARVVPAAAVVKLRKVALWFSPEYPGVPPRAEYHPAAAWLREHGRDPAMARGVEFTNARIFEAEARRMRNFALHELAHAYHDIVLGHEQPEIQAAYEHARAGGTYDRVEQRLGNGRSAPARAYALANAQEYFAETTEAFFSRNDFYPFTRDDLKAHDPRIFALLERLWGEAEVGGHGD